MGVGSTYPIALTPSNTAGDRPNFVKAMCQYGDEWNKCRMRKCSSIDFLSVKAGQASSLPLRGEQIHSKCRSRRLEARATSQAEMRELPRGTPPRFLPSICFHQAPGLTHAATLAPGERITQVFAGL